MKRMKRDPVRFDVFAALAHYASKHRLSIRDDQSVTKFLDAIRGTTRGSLNNEAFIYGFRVQSMFETVVASLGNVKLLKQEDAGNAYYAGNVDLALPDYRIVLKDGTQLLIEVKNFSQTTGTQPYVDATDYLHRLEAYAAVTQSELLVAVFWHRWNMWTLVPPNAFVTTGRRARLELPAAILANQMGRLGDKMIGTRWPLRLRLEVDEREREGKERRCLIRNATLHSEDRILVDPVERRIAMFLILNGSWDETTVMEEQEAKTSVIEMQYAPAEDTGNQREHGFEFVGSMSAMISNFFRQGTIDDGDEVKGFHVDFNPGEFGQLIPDDYKFGETALPLWVLTIQGNVPNHSLAQAPP